MMKLKHFKLVLVELKRNQALKNGISLMITIESLHREKESFKFWKQSTFEILGLSQQVYECRLLNKAF